jgi:hypothetical protein
MKHKETMRKRKRIGFSNTARHRRGFLLILLELRDHMRGWEQKGKRRSREDDIKNSEEKQADKNLAPKL